MADPEDMPLDMQPQNEIMRTRKDGKFHDWRDYNLYQFGGIDPNALCVYPADTEDLDSPEYQALSASCKLELMWQKVLADTYREDFFVGPEFTSLFN